MELMATGNVTTEKTTAAEAAEKYLVFFAVPLVANLVTTLECDLFHFNTELDSRGKCNPNFNHWVQSNPSS